MSIKNIKKRVKRWLINWLLEGQFNGFVVANNTITDSELTNFSMNIETLYLNGGKFKNVKLVFELDKDAVNESTINPKEVR